MRRHTYLSIGMAIGLSLALLAPNLAGAGPVGELLGGAPVAGPIIDPDGDGNADLPVLTEDTCEGHDDRVDQDSDTTPDGCDTDRDGDGVENDTDLWPDDPSQTVDADGDGVSDERDACAGHDDAVDQDADGTPDGCDSDRDGDGADNGTDLWPDDGGRSTPAHAITAFTTQFRAGNRAANQASELAVTSISPVQVANGQHAWTSGASAPLRVEWLPGSSQLKLTVGTDVTTLAVTSVQDIRALQILVRSGSSTMIASLSDLVVNGEALPTGPITATNTTVSRGFGAVSWNQGFTMTGTVTFTYGLQTPGNNDLEVLVSLGR